MPKTADVFIECCYSDLFPSIPVLVDYFGNAWNNTEHSCVVLGIYQGLVKRHGVTANVLHEHFLTNRLNELVHSVYKDNETFYYKKFCDLGIDLKTVTNLCDMGELV